MLRVISGILYVSLEAEKTVSKPVAREGKGTAGAPQEANILAQRNSGVRRPANLSFPELGYVPEGFGQASERRPHSPSEGVAKLTHELKPPPRYNTRCSFFCHLRRFKL